MKFTDIFIRNPVLATVISLLILVLGLRALAQLPVLADGQNLERNGLRCSAYNGGVACGNVSAGVGFFVSTERYELIPGPDKSTAPPQAGASKTP